MQKFHLTSWENTPNDYSILQGAYYGFTIYYPELDLSNYGFSGQIRATADSQEILASFNFSPVVYGQISGETGDFSKIPVFLNASQTIAIPPTKLRNSRSDTIKEGSNVYVYDIEAVNPLNSEHIIKLIAKSWVEVVAEVTR